MTNRCGMRKRTGCPFRARCRLVLRTGFATLQATLPGERPASLDAGATPGQRPGFTRVRVPPPCGHGCAAFYLWWPEATNGRSPRGFVAGGALHRSLVFFRVLAIPTVVCPSPARPAQGVHKSASHCASLHVYSRFTKLPCSFRACPLPPTYGPGTQQKTVNERAKSRRKQKFVEAEESSKSGDFFKSEVSKPNGPQGQKANAMKPSKTDFFVNRSGTCRRHFEESAVYCGSALDFKLDADGEYSDPETNHRFTWFSIGYRHPEFSLKDIVDQNTLLKVKTKEKP